MLKITIYFPGGASQTITGEILQTHIHGAVLIKDSINNLEILYPVTSIFMLTIKEE